MISFRFISFKQIEVNLFAKFELILQVRNLSEEMIVLLIMIFKPLYFKGVYGSKKYSRHFHNPEVESSNLSLATKINTP